MPAAPRRDANGAQWRKARARLKRTAMRNGDPCHICGNLIDFDAHPSTPWSFSADHIVATASTGRADNSASNLAPAHRWCNGWRQHRPLEQARADVGRALAVKRAADEYDAHRPTGGTTATGDYAAPATACRTCDRGETLPISRDWLGDATGCARGMLHRPAEV
ncbi:HNH endonuclease [Tomitella gaofuii]|uniref:HNH endonuclease n=1 Tax=Tomitella gaofuii TaxID=2760083 RepID=UPI0015FB071D|nr:hypothetical protein [Tomitella gaofuii]